MLKDNYDPESDENAKPPKFFQIQHFLNFLWNFPRWTLEDLINKYRKPTKEEVSLKLENELLRKLNQGIYLQLTPPLPTDFRPKQGGGVSWRFGEWQ